MRGSSGFTLPELIVTLVIVGILAVVVAPRFSSQSNFDVFGYAEQTRSALRYAQKSAIAKRRTVCVNITSTGLALTIASTFGGACNTSMLDQSTGSAYAQSIPSGATISTASFSFDSSGAASAAQTITIAAGTTTQTITVEAGTGYVH